MVGEKIKRRKVFCDVKIIWNSIFIVYVLLEYSPAHLLISVATVTLQWQSWVAVSETIRPTKSEILTIWPFADPWSKVSALPHNTFSSQFTLLRLLYPSIPCDCSCQGKQYFPCCQVQKFPVTYLSTALYTGGSSLLVIPFPPGFHDLYSHFFLPTAHCANPPFSVKLKV